MNKQTDNRKVLSGALFASLLIVFFITLILINRITGTPEMLVVMGNQIPLAMFTGVLSSLANMCMVLIVVFCGKRGFITALVLLFSQFPMVILQLVRGHNLSILPGIFTNVLVITVIIMIHQKNRRIEVYQNTQLDYFKARQKGAERLFEQTATAFVNAIDAKDEKSRGHSVRVAEYSRRIAQKLGKNEEECREVYYAALLHDVGKIGVPDGILSKSGKLTPEEYEVVKQHPVLGQQILSSITEYPFLSIGADYHHERYDGKGYPHKLKGEDIPEIARIIAVAGAYDEMSSEKSYRGILPQQVVREEIVKGSGTQFDPKIANIMQHLIDQDADYQMKERQEVRELAGKNEIYCGSYRDEVSEGILVNPFITRIRLQSVPDESRDANKHIPTIILFDSLDGRVHDDERTIRELNYLEYAEIWLDGKVVVNGARKAQTDTVKETDTRSDRQKKGAENRYDIEAVKVKDHVSIRIDDGSRTTRVILALPDSTRYAYIALTGEHCTIRDVSVIKTEETAGADSIPRIAPEISYIDRIEGDVPNVQVDGYRTAATAGIPITDGLEIRFHTMSLPTARLIWHCPFFIVFSSEDGLVNGRNYKECALVRLDGEYWESAEEDVSTELYVDRKASFVGWEAWKEINRKGYDCSLTFEKKGNRITIVTENQGIFIRATTCVNEKDAYVALSGDQVALTDIRIL